MTYNKIIIPTRPHADTILGIFLLRTFGKEKYPGIEKAGIDIWQELPKGETVQSLEKKGVLSLDIGRGKFDHHFQKGKTLSQLVAEDLDISGNPTLNKLLSYAERDDKYGLGTISSDQIDRAFGLSGLIISLTKALPENPEKVIDLISPLLTAHLIAEKERTEGLPKEFEVKLKEGKAEIFEIKQDKKKLTVVVLECDNLGMAGWLRSSEGQKADVVCQKVASGYVNILTRPLKRVDLRWLAAYIRNEEANLRGRKLRYSTFDLMSPAKIFEVPEWYYDRATNSILNGGPNPKGIEPTAIPFDRLKEILKEALAQETVKQNYGNNFQSITATANQYFLEIRLPLEIAQKIKDLLVGLPAGIKAHLPENYHITLMYFGNLGENYYKTIEAVKKVLSEFTPFEIAISKDNFKSGIVPGYPAKAFYFEIGDREGVDSLKKIRIALEKEAPVFQDTEFFPHLTVASAMPQIEEKVIKEAEITIKDGNKTSFTVDKIRLTEVFKRPSGETAYKAKGYFSLDKIIK